MNNNNEDDNEEDMMDLDPSSDMANELQQQQQHFNAFLDSVYIKPDPLQPDVQEMLAYASQMPRSHFAMQPIKTEIGNFRARRLHHDIYDDDDEYDNDDDNDDDDDDDDDQDEDQDEDDEDEENLIILDDISIGGSEHDRMDGVAVVSERHQASSPYLQTKDQNASNDALVEAALGQYTRLANPLHQSSSQQREKIHGPSALSDEDKRWQDEIDQLLQLGKKQEAKTGDDAMDDEDTQHSRKTITPLSDVEAGQLGRTMMVVKDNHTRRTPVNILLADDKDPLCFTTEDQHRNEEFNKKLQVMAVRHLTETFEDDPDYGLHEGVDGPDGTGHVAGEVYQHTFNRTLMRRFVELRQLMDEFAGKGMEQQHYNASGTPTTAYAAGTNGGDPDRLPRIPDVPRNYNRQFQREAIPELGEPSCRLGMLCESVALCRVKHQKYGMQGANNSSVFIMRAFLAPDKLEKVQTAIIDGVPPAEAYAQMGSQLCLFCTRIAQQSLALTQGACLNNQPDVPLVAEEEGGHNNAGGSGSGGGQRTPTTRAKNTTRRMPADAENGHLALVQTHANLFDVPGEYRSDTAMLRAGTNYQGLIKPVVKYCRSHYVRSQHRVQISVDETRTVQAWDDDTSIIYTSAQYTRSQVNKESQHRHGNKGGSTGNTHNTHGDQINTNTTGPPNPSSAFHNNKQR